MVIRPSVSYVMQERLMAAGMWYLVKQCVAFLGREESLYATSSVLHLSVCFNTILMVCAVGND